MEYNELLNHLKESENLRSFAKRINYFDRLLPKIGSGSGSSVYDIDGSYVLKLAKNPKGISQNEVEASISAYDYNHDIITIVKKYDDNDIWLISEKAKKITPKRFKEILGFDIENAYNYLHNRLSDNRTTKYGYDIDPQIKSVLDEDEWMIDIFRLIQDHDIKIGDFNRISSFGEVIRYGQPAVVVIDYGLSDEVYTTHYARSGRIYEMFNDQDGNDDILTDDNFNTSNIEILNGGAGATPIPQSVEERVLSSMTGSSSVVVKDECRLGGGKTCNQGDIKNLKIKGISEDVNAEDVNDILGTINSIRTNQREIGFLGYIPQNYFRLINQSDIGLLPVDQGNNKIGYILYKNKKKALSLNNYLKTKGGYAKDDTPEEARIIGKLLDYNDKTIEEYIRRKYKTQPIPVNTKTEVDFNDLDENIKVNEMGKIEKFTQELRRKPFIDHIINNLNGEIYVVGGATRDLILNKPNKDIDLVIRNIPIDTLIQNLEKFGKIDVVGKSFGVIKLIDSDGLDYDIALPRTDKMNGEGGYKGFDIQSDENLPIESDLIRRDIKFNAMAISINTGKFIDPLNGLDDIKDKKISAANSNTFSDDPLRMLRVINFSSRFGFTIEPKTMEMIKSNANRIKEIPSERILGEFDKIVKKGDTIKGIVELVSSGIYKVIFGVNFGVSKIPTNKIKQISTISEFIFVLMFGKVQNPSEFYLSRFSKEDAKRDKIYKDIKALELAFEVNNFNPSALRIIAHNMYLTSPEVLSSKIIDNKIGVACNELLSGKYPKTVNELAVNGGELMNLGLKGKEIGDMQKSILIKVYADKLKNNKEDILLDINTNKTEPITVN